MPLAPGTAAAGRVARRWRAAAACGGTDRRGLADGDAQAPREADRAQLAASHAEARLRWLAEQPWVVSAEMRRLRLRVAAAEADRDRWRARYRRAVRRTTTERANR
jgi:hypothetical protein